MREERQEQWEKMLEDARQMKCHYIVGPTRVGDVEVWEHVKQFGKFPRNADTADLAGMRRNHVLVCN